MKLVNSRTTQLNYGQILTQYHQNYVQNKPGPTKDLQVWLITTAHIMQTMNSEGMIIGNTFFMYKRGNDEDSDKVIVWAMNVDTLQNMVDNLAEFGTRILSEGVTTIVSIYETDPMITRIVRQAFNKIKFTSDEIKFKKVGGMTYAQASLLGEENV